MAAKFIPLPPDHVAVPDTCCVKPAHTVNGMMKQARCLSCGATFTFDKNVWTQLPVTPPPVDPVKPNA